MPYKSLKQKKEYNKKWTKENKSKVVEYQKKYQLEYYYKNKETILAKQKQRNVENPEKRYLTNRKSDLKKYGITIVEYELMEKKQNCRCAICGKKQSGKKLAVDHCHKTGRVRGLLCGNCNSGIGKLNDDVEILKKALKYLQ